MADWLQALGYGTGEEISNRPATTETHSLSTQQQMGTIFLNQGRLNVAKGQGWLSSFVCCRVGLHHSLPVLTTTRPGETFTFSEAVIEICAFIYMS